MTEEELEARIAERNAAFENDDMEWAFRVAPPNLSRMGIIAGFHKARYDCTHISDAKRRESQKFLARHSLSALHEPWRSVTMDDPLPAPQTQYDKTDVSTEWRGHADDLRRIAQALYKRPTIDVDDDIAVLHDLASKLDENAADYERED